MSDNVLDQAAVTVDVLLGLWPRLAGAVVPGTRRRWVEQQQTLDASGQPRPEPSCERCATCQSIRLRRPGQVVKGTGVTLPGKSFCPQGCDEGEGSLGYSRSPAADEALSVLVSVATDLAWLEDNVREELGFTALDEHDPEHEAHRHRQSLGRLAGRDPERALVWIREALPALTGHADLARHVEKELARMARTVRRSLGDVEEVHPIKAPCPICGCMSLRAFPEREVIVCVHENCRCEQEECRCTIDGHYRHRWGRLEWPWLAKVIGVDLELGELTG